VRAHFNDVTYLALNGDSVKFVMVRNSGGDMEARLVTAN
jgi:hypothetical protein